MNRPAISVIVPVLNGEDVLSVTLASLVRQQETVPDLEVIGINDGSTDRTGEVFQHFDGRLSNLTVLTHDSPVGLASARNRGLEVARGERLVFLDGDDWLAPQRLSTLAASLDALGCDFVRTDHVVSRDRVRSTQIAPFFPRNTVASPRDGIGPYDRPTMVDYPYSWAGMFSRRLLDAGLLSFHEGLKTAEDRPWIWRLHLQAQSFAVVDAPPLFYRRGVATSLTQIFDERQLDFLRAFELALAVVEADAQAEQWMPKYVRQISAIAEHHLERSPEMTRPVRRRLREGLTDLFARVGAPALAAQWRHLPATRRRVLRPYMPAGVRKRSRP